MARRKGTAGRTTRARRAPASGSTVGAYLVAAMREAVAIERGDADPARISKVPLTARTTKVDGVPSYSHAQIARIREGLALSQPVFASVLNVSPDAVRKWEQGVRQPDGAALRLLQLVAEHPTWVLEKLRPYSADAPRRKPGR